MENKTQIINPANNGDMNDLLNLKFGIRILADYAAYDQITDYFKDVSVKIKIVGEKTYYIFNKKTEEIARTRDLGRIIELTPNVDDKIRDKVNYILY